ncbi:DNA-protecting protein DprA [Paeniglutamicibacter gangotriensis]|uniref:DNA-protecting protein DprA n=1 Tax=Paeniglutamicibacter gangotriensis TaxID=254787 RepID=A0A5B0EEV0_9MICC|nr:DNA-processing protein DprA [Paeniglutamicibacter gangotriensis]KAA0977186.1 DNA-protecting protein DprA [Paeniglutamicibacter gangotriensis]
MNTQRIAYAAWTDFSEPCDGAARALLAAVGPEKGLAIVEQDATMTDSEREIFNSHKSTNERNLEDALYVWKGKYRGREHAQASLALIERLGGGFLTPEDENWPIAGNDPRSNPIGLWWRGNMENGIPEKHRAMAIVGSRDATEYGRQATAEISIHAATNGVTVVSGGAYGIDATAHEAALSAEGNEFPTIAVMAGGLDRYYPVGNADLLTRIAERGTVLSEIAPGKAPTRWRFLARNRLIAGLTGATVVTEARWRSGAMTTANHAKTMGRNVGAVPGSVFSANSAGTHRLIRDGIADLVTTGADALNLLDTNH